MTPVKVEIEQEEGKVIVPSSLPSHPPPAPAAPALLRSQQEKQRAQWEDYTKQQISRYFWDWDVLLDYLDLRDEFLDDFLKHPRKEYSGAELLPPSLWFFVSRIRCAMSEMKLSRIQTCKKLDEEGKYEWSMKYDPIPLAAGHYGIVFDYTTHTPGRASVLKLGRYEHMKRPLDIYSFFMEIIMNLLIQYRGFHCTPEVLNVVKMPGIEDVGYVMEKMSTNLYDFFLRGLGATNYEAGVRVLQDTAAQLYRLQDQFRFRHRDFRMKNIMIARTPIQAHCVRIIDLGKASMVFQGTKFSAYAGQTYEVIGRDFDLGFFFADMMIHFQRSTTYKRQLELYQGMLDHFLQGIRYEHLVPHKSHLAYLMEQVHLRKPATRKYSTPRYVFLYLNEILENIARNNRRKSKRVVRFADEVSIH